MNDKTTPYKINEARIEELAIKFRTLSFIYRIKSLKLLPLSE